MALAILGWCGIACAGRVLFVAGDAGNTGDGLTWDAPFEHLRDAITVARPGDEIWVKHGTYHPSVDDATASFALKTGVALYGGFAGNEELREQRDWKRFPTRLSGDLGGDDQPEPHTAIGANSGHVVACGGVDATAVLDGFIIERGAGGPPGTSSTSSLVHGSGMFCLGGSPTVRNCTFRDNTAPHKSGGAVYVLSGSPTFEQCSFERNVARSGGGGAVCAEGDSALTLTDCTFIDNTCYGGVSRQGGGALLFDATGVLALNGCSFTTNQSLPSLSGPITSGGGGAAAIARGSAFARNCSFEGNQAPFGGGVLANAPLVLINCLIAHNAAQLVPTVQGEPSSSGGGVWTASPLTLAFNCTITMNEGTRAAGVDATMGTVAMTNSIVWGNQSRDSALAGLWQSQISDRFELRHCCVEGLFQPGPVDGTSEARPVMIACLSADPLFLAPDAGDFHLSRTSPCIDTGEAMLAVADLEVDLDGSPRLVALRNGPVQIDMGCFERASISGCYEIGDADGDGSVGVGDLNYLLHDFGSRGIDLAADLNDDRLIDINDLNIMLSNWGSPCVAAPPPSGGTQPVDDAVHAQDRDDRTTTAAARLIP
ncbi:MAG: right-handed parallel beta-helix repeat-containing protein [Phycisphaerales bacterium]|nr:right-handed parallel beta-helix repeat-containing protein [Phycisphaerales bacterium]